MQGPSKTWQQMYGFVWHLAGKLQQARCRLDCSACSTADASRPGQKCAYLDTDHASALHVDECHMVDGGKALDRHRPCLLLVCRLVADLSACNEGCFSRGLHWAFTFGV